MSPSARTPARGERVETVEQPAHDAFDRGAGEVLRASSTCAARRSCPTRRAGSGVRSPSKYGTTTTPPAPGGAASASASSPAWSTPSQRAIASVTFVAFSVHTSGRKRPVASAKPATAPVGSAVGDVAHRVDGARRAERDRDVARLQRRARARRPCCRRCRARRPRRVRTRVVVPARSVGASTRGRRGAQSAAASTIASRSSAVLVASRRRSSRCPTRRRGRSRTRPSAST